MRKWYRESKTLALEGNSRLRSGDINSIGVNCHDSIARRWLHCMQRSVRSSQIQIKSERPEQCDLFCCRVDCGRMAYSLAACFLSVITR